MKSSDVKENDVVQRPSLRVSLMPSKRLSYEQYLKAKLLIFKGSIKIGGPCGVWMFGCAPKQLCNHIFDWFPKHYLKTDSPWWDCCQPDVEVVVVPAPELMKMDMKPSLALWSSGLPFVVKKSTGDVMVVKPSLVVVVSLGSIFTLIMDEDLCRSFKRSFKEMPYDFS